MRIICQVSIRVAQTVLPVATLQDTALRVSPVAQIPARARGEVWVGEGERLEAIAVQRVCQRRGSISRRHRYVRCRRRQRQVGGDGPVPVRQTQAYGSGLVVRTRGFRIVGGQRVSAPLERIFENCQIGAVPGEEVDLLGKRIA
jgi:hypothetical protein